MDLNDVKAGFALLSLKKSACECLRQLCSIGANLQCSRKKIQKRELEELLDIDPCQTLEESSAALDIDRSTVGKWLHTLGIVQKIGNWVPQGLKERNIERRLVTCEMLLQRQERKNFLHRVITCDEKWIDYDNPKRKIAWVESAEPGPSTPKRNIHGLKVMLCMWWVMRAIAHYERLKQAIQNGNSYSSGRNLHYLCSKTH
ncbi:hypothetical protein Trydic_g1074 [Trypoxylus dichotomus]